MENADEVIVKRIRIAVTTDSTSRKAGGLFWSVNALSMEAVRNNCEVAVFSGKDEFSDLDFDSWSGIELNHSNILGPRYFGFQKGMVRKIKVFRPDVIHQHGLWMYPSLVSCQLKKKDIPYIISPHGMLDDWALRNSSWKKNIARALYENRNLAGAHCIHALCESEMRSIRKIGIKLPIAVIPNGIHVPSFSASEKPEWLKSMPCNTKVVLFLGRIHPKKGLVELLKAWALCMYKHETQSRGWILVISGWTENGHEEDLKILSKQLGITDSVMFVGPSYNQEKSACFQYSDAFILPSRSEGLPMAVLEAWSHRLPVVMSSECNLQEGFDSDAAIKVDPECMSIQFGLQRLFRMTKSERVEMGERGLSLVKEKFEWTAIGKQMNEVYKWMVGAIEPPACVNFNEKLIE